MANKTIGQVAYEQWVELVPIAYAQNIAWVDLPKTAKVGWEEIAAAAVNHYMDQHRMMHDAPNRPLT